MFKLTGKCLIRSFLLPPSTARVFSMTSIKRSRSLSDDSEPSKRQRPTTPSFRPIKVASAENAGRVDADPPMNQLEKLLEAGSKKAREGKCVIYWMRMADLRVKDNRALSQASEEAARAKVPLIALYIISPQDYVAHDRSARKIDFILRNLTEIKLILSELHIPFLIQTWTTRKTIPAQIIELCETYEATSLFANLDYEVDELRRDIEVCKLAAPINLQVKIPHNRAVIEPGVILNKNQQAYGVYSPYLKAWRTSLNKNLPYYLEDCPIPLPNLVSIRESKLFAPLFASEVPGSVVGFKLQDDDKRRMEALWPAGEVVAHQILNSFLTSKVKGSHIKAEPSFPQSGVDSKKSRGENYHQDRDRLDSDTTSRLSPYLACGIISIRECVRRCMILLKAKQVDAGRDDGLGRWIQELAWRDFYLAILASYPRVSMGRPYLEKFAGVVWENHQAPGDTSADVAEGSDADALKRWKMGMTGVPIVDAAMRCINQTGWVHNRARMITAMYLTKDLMIDWRVGERYFMENLIDGDLASNNGGWQWSASTGVDPCPYFRIFNPYTQSQKADPNGDFIRHYVPELAKLKGQDLHDPPVALRKKLGYPLPIIDHKAARDRALRRYKDPGQA